MHHSNFILRGKVTRLLLASVPFGFAMGCGEDEPEAAAPAEAGPAEPERVATATGFETPESVRYDPDQDVYFVSNIVGVPSAKDGAGYISRMTAEGVVDSLHFIMSGRSGVELNAPKGMAISGDTLWVTDVDAVRGFDRRTGAPLVSVDLGPQGAVFLNDVAVGSDGAKYVTDTGLAFGDDGTMSHPGPDRIFRIDGAGTSVLAEGEMLSLPNGIAVDPAGGFLLAPNGAAQIHRWGGNSEAPVPGASGPGGYDGIEVLADGRALVSSWTDSTVYVMQGDSLRPLIRGVNSPADIGVDTRRNRVAIPLFLENRVEIWTVN